MQDVTNPVNLPSCYCLSR